jgi:carbamoyl-phosphate synthase small subunit
MVADSFHQAPHLRKKARIILDDGSWWEGRVFAAGGERFAEIIFNTGMVGYQELLTDPSYTGQAVVMTYPLIGNYGINPEDFESRKIFLEALICREYVPFSSNWRSTKTLKTFLDESGILGIDQVDTRSLTKHIRTKGASKAVLTVFDNPVEEYVEKLRSTTVLERYNVAKFASCDAKYTWSKPRDTQFRVAVIDCGVKHSILKYLHLHNCESTVYTSQVHDEELLEQGYDGVFLSNGPGDPQPLHNLTRVVRQLLGKVPIFGICLGHQVLAQALGLKTYKLKFGHHGINHPIRNLHTGKIEIASHNHNFAIDPRSLSDEVAVTHLNLNDHTIAGIRHKNLPAFSVQYHPEAAPGPQDSLYLFAQFCQEMKDFRSHRAQIPVPFRPWMKFKGSPLEEFIA